MEKRKSVRKICPGEIFFSYRSGYFNIPESSEIFACTVDKNDSGLCLVSSYPLEKGQAIIIKKGPGLGEIAEVRWARQIINHIYKGGVCLQKKETTEDVVSNAV